MDFFCKRFASVLSEIDIDSETIQELYNAISYGKVDKVRVILADLPKEYQEVFVEEAKKVAYSMTFFYAYKNKSLKKREL